MVDLTNEHVALAWNLDMSSHGWLTLPPPKKASRNVSSAHLRRGTIGSISRKISGHKRRFPPNTAAGLTTS